MKNLMTKLRGSSVWVRRVLLAGMIVLAWSPAVMTASMMHRYAVNIPVWDDLERAELLSRYESGTLDWSYLLSAHIEHRIVLPRLIMLANAKWFGGDMTHEVAVNYLAILISAIGLAVLVWKTRPGRQSNWLLIFLINLCVFSLLQYQNLCWAIQTAFFLPLTFLVLTILILRSSLSLWTQFGLCLLCTLCATGSFSHGLALWGLVPVYFLLSAERWTVKQRLAAVALWGGIALVVVFFYFHGLTSTSHPGHCYLQKPGEAPPGLGSLLAGHVNPGKVIASFLFVLGGPYSRLMLIRPAMTAAGVGMVLLALFGILSLLGVFHCLRRRSAADWKNLLPWLAIGGYAVGASLLVALGRSNESLGRTMSLRYITISLYLSVALIALCALVPLHLCSERGRGRLLTAGSLFAGFFIALQAWTWLFGAWALQQWNAARWQSLAGYVFRDFSKSEHSIRLDYSPDYAVEQLDRLVAMGHLQLPQPVSADSFGQFSIAPETVGPIDGSVIRIFPAEEGESKDDAGWRIDGFTDIRSYTRRPPDAVLFTAGEGDQRVIVGFAEPFPTPVLHFIRLDFEFSDLHLPCRNDEDRWSGCIREARLPAGSGNPVEITVWAVDLKHSTLYRQEKGFKLHPGAVAQSCYEHPRRIIHLDEIFPVE